MYIIAAGGSWSIEVHASHMTSYKFCSIDVQNTICFIPLYVQQQVWTYGLFRFLPHASIFIDLFRSNMFSECWSSLSFVTLTATPRQCPVRLELNLRLHIEPLACTLLYSGELANNVDMALDLNEN